MMHHEGNLSRHATAGASLRVGLQASYAQSDASRTRPMLVKVLSHTPGCWQRGYASQEVYACTIP